MTPTVGLEHDDSATAEVIRGDVHRPSLRIGIIAAAISAIAISTRSGVGLTITLAALLVAMAVAVGWSTSAGRWCLATMALLPWLVIRDNTWLAISIIGTVCVVLTLAGAVSATGQSMMNQSLGAVFRIGTVPSNSAPRSPADDGILAVIRGLLVAVPVVAVFWRLLASADEVFASVVNFSSVPLVRIGLFVAFAPLFAAIAIYARTTRTPKPKTPWTAAQKLFGPVESSIVLGAVAALFAVFVTLRLATLGRALDEATWRSEVRSGFFQLLWVAALTVLLVLAIRQASGAGNLAGRVRWLAWLTIALAAAIDVLAMMRISEYVERSFQSPLRFWSFGFGLWLLVILALTAFRLTDRSGEKLWFTAATVASGMVFLFALGVINPDHRIAQHNFEHAPTGEDEWIAIKPLMWLSEDATEVIVENIEVLRPMPNDRYPRMVRHLCTRDLGGSWREAHLSRTSAAAAIEDLCGG